MVGIWHTRHSISYHILRGKAIPCAELFGKAALFFTGEERFAAAGAGFVVVLTGDIMTMPGLPKVPAATKIDVDDNGVISGLF